MIIRH